MQPMKMMPINSDVERCSKYYKITCRIIFVKIIDVIYVYFCVLMHRKKV